MSLLFKFSSFSSWKMWGSLLCNILHWLINCQILFIYIFKKECRSWGQSRNVTYSQDCGSWKHFPSRISELLWTSDWYGPPSSPVWMGMFIADVLSLAYHYMLEVWEMDNLPRGLGSKGAAAGPDVDHEKVDFELDATGCFSVLQWEWLIFCMWEGSE